MKRSSRLAMPVVFLVAAYLAFFGVLLGTVPELPERIATHFKAGGEPDGWMSRSGYMRSSIGFTVGFPLLPAALVLLARFLPVSALNLPNREYWFGVERRDESFAWLLRLTLWFSCLAVLFMLGIHLSVIEANRHFPARLSNPLLLGIAGLFLLGVGGWVFVLVRHFAGGPREGQASLGRYKG